MLHEKHIGWIEARGLSGDLARKLGLETIEKHGKAWLAVPYVENGRLVNHKYRLTSNKRHLMDDEAPLVLWNHDCLLERSDTPVVITEGEWDAMTALALGWRAVSVPNGSPGKASEDPAQSKRYDFLWRAQAVLNQVKSFIIAADDDEAGRALRQDLIALLGAERCKFIDKYGADCKDLNDTLQRYGIEAVSDLLNRAKSVPIRGLYKLSDFPEPAPWPEIAIGVPGLSEFLSIVPATLTVLTGWAGQGKTTLLLQIVASLLRQGISVTLGSFETMARPILQRKLRAALIQCNEHSIPVTRIAWADELIEKHLSLIAQMVGEDQEMSLEDVLDFAGADHHRNGSKVLIIDPWNEIEHKRRSDESGTEYVGRCIRAVKHFMRARNIAVWVVEHPAKPEAGNVKAVPGLYNASGSAHWANKADYGVVYSRPDKESNRAEVHVTKVRLGLPGHEGKIDLAYDWRVSGFVDARQQDQAA